MIIKKIINIFVLIALIFSTRHIFLDSNHNTLCYIGFILIVIGSLLVGFDHFRNQKNVRNTK